MKSYSGHKKSTRSRASANQAIFSEKNDNESSFFPSSIARLKAAPLFSLNPIIQRKPGDDKKTKSNPNTSQSIHQERVYLQQQNEKVSTPNELVNVSENSTKKINDAIVGDFRIVIDKVKQLTNQDLGKEFGDTTRAMSKATSKVGADNFSWHKTGRAIDLAQGLNWVILEDKQGKSMYFNLYLKKTSEDSTTYDAIFSKESPPNIHHNPYGDNIYKHTFIDVTKILEENGFSRIKAHKGWEKVYDKREWWHYEQTDGLSMYDALRQLYKEDDIITSYKKFATKEGILRMYREGFPEPILQEMTTIDVNSEIGKYEFNQHFDSGDYSAALVHLEKMNLNEIKTTFKSKDSKKLKDLRALAIEKLRKQELKNYDKEKLNQILRHAKKKEEKN